MKALWPKWMDLGYLLEEQFWGEVASEVVDDVLDDIILSGVPQVSGIKKYSRK